MSSLPDVNVLLSLAWPNHPHANHRFVAVAPTVVGAPFDELVPKIIGYQQVTDAALLHVARFHGLKLVTFDQGAAAVCPWPGNLEILVP